MQEPRETSAIAPVSEPGGSGAGERVEVARRAAELPVDGLAVGADDRADVDERLVVLAQAGGVASRRLEGDAGRKPGARRAATSASARRRACSTRRRRRSRRARCPGEPTRAEAEVVAVVARGDDRDDAGGCDVVHGLDERVVRRVGLGPPPEKLITSMPSLTASSKAATICGVKALLPIGRRRVEDAVVAEPRARRDAGQARDLRVVRPGRRRRPGVAGGDPGDVRAVERRLADRAASVPASPEPGPGNTRATITFGVVHFVWPRGKPGG